jgi:hypothetical protein
VAIDSESVTMRFTVNADVLDEDPIQFLSMSPPFHVTSIQANYTRSVGGPWMERTVKATGVWVRPDGFRYRRESVMPLATRDQPEWVRQFVRDNRPKD